MPRRAVDKTAGDKLYKVWVNVEEVDEPHGKYTNLGEPYSLGAFPDANLADRFVRSLPGFDRDLADNYLAKVHDLLHHLALKEPGTMDFEAAKREAIELLMGHYTG